MPHFLSIGGTGMLARATLELASEAEVATIVARNADRFVTSHGLPIESAVDADWRQAEGFLVAVGRAIDLRGPVDLAVVWLHSDEAQALEGLLPLLDAADCRLVHVLGSAAGDPRQGSRGRGATRASRRACCARASCYAGRR